MHKSVEVPPHAWEPIKVILSPSPPTLLLAARSSGKPEKKKKRLISFKPVVLLFFEMTIYMTIYTKLYINIQTYKVGAAGCHYLQIWDSWA